MSVAVDAPTTASGLLAAKERTRPLPTLAIAVLVTCAVAIPLTLLALDARNNPPDVVIAPADAQLITVDTASTDRVPLDAQTVSGSLRISLQESAASIVSFNLFASGADAAIVRSQDVEGPQFDFVVGESGTGEPFDSTLLQNGDYELFVTIRTPDEDRRTAVSFTVQNP